jgi:hypothetical protein
MERMNQTWGIHGNVTINPLYLYYVPVKLLKKIKRKNPLSD